MPAGSAAEPSRVDHTLRSFPTEALAVRPCGLIDFDTASLVEPMD